jgi:hypothetical protein
VRNAIGERDSLAPSRSRSMEWRHGGTIKEE